MTALATTHLAKFGHCAEAKGRVNVQFVIFFTK